MAELEITTGLAPFCFEKNAPVPLAEKYPLLPVQNSKLPSYSVRPNIFGEWANTHAAYPSAEVVGASYFKDAQNPKMMSTLNETASAHMGFNASRVSSLYQDIDEVRVNALFGLNLIKAF